MILSPPSDTVTSAESLLSSAVAVTLVLPSAIPVTVACALPSALVSVEAGSTVATDSSSDANSTFTPSLGYLPLLTVAVTISVSPTFTSMAGGDTVTPGLAHAARTRMLIANASIQTSVLLILLKLMTFPP